MKPALRHLHFTQGATFSELYRLWVDKEKTTRYDLSLFGVRMQIRTVNNGSGTLIWDSASPTAGSSLGITNAPGGEITLTFNADVIAAMTAGTYFYDMEVYLLSAPAATVFRLFNGKVFLNNDNVTV